MRCCWVSIEAAAIIDACGWAEYGVEMARSHLFAELPANHRTDWGEHSRTPSPPSSIG
jgi:hypothetical protein